VANATLMNTKAVAAGNSVKGAGEFRDSQQCVSLSQIFISGQTCIINPLIGDDLLAR